MKNDIPKLYTFFPGCFFYYYRYYSFCLLNTFLPSNHWRFEMLEITQKEWKSCGIFKKKKHILCITGQWCMPLINTWQCLGTCSALSLKKQHREGNAVKIFYVASEPWFWAYFDTSRDKFLMYEGCTSPTELAATQEAVFAEHLASGVVLWGYICQPARQSTRKLECNWPDSKEGKTQYLYECLCRLLATKAEVTCQTLLGLSRLWSIL